MRTIIKAKNYDIVIVGGGIGGSVSAIKLAQQGKKVLLIEKETTPRHKACSGIQFPYFEKLIGVKIPKKDLENTPLTATQLTHTELDFPRTSNGNKRKNMSAPFPMLNFMRNTFDDWLNKQAKDKGAEFHDRTTFEDLQENPDGTINIIINKAGVRSTVNTKYIIAADGINSSVRKKLRPTDFEKPIEQQGSGINYYIKPDDETKIKLPKTTLLQIWNTDFNNDMFAWVYIKDEPKCKGMDEKTKSGECTNAWVVGTSYTGKPIEDIGKKLLNYVSDTYGLDGEILRTEKIKVDLALSNPEKRFAFGDGENGNILYVGDAAGLIDPVRGLGMDASALSSTKAVNSILETDNCKRKNQSCPTASELYTQKMSQIKKQLTEGSQKVKGVFTNNDELDTYLKREMGWITGLKKIICTKLNDWKDPEKMNLC